MYKKLIRTFYSIITPFRKLYWFIFRPKTFGVKVVVYHNNKVLMVRHSYGQSQWIFPGGGIKKNELPEEAARREIREEIGIELSKVIKIGEFISNKEYKKDTIFVFSGEAKSLELEIDKNEIAEVRWFDTNEPFKLSEYSQKIMSMVKSPISNF